jgi:hypothetical protein
LRAGLPAKRQDRQSDQSSIRIASNAMLIPQYTLRWLLGVTTACAVVFSIFALAMRGSYWAQGFSAGVIALVVLLLAHGLMFTMLWVFSLVTTLLRPRAAARGQTPFAARPAGSDVGPGSC